MGGAYIGESMVKAQADSRLTRAELVALSRNAFQAAWIGEAERARYLARLDAFAGRWAAPRDGAL
jgi:adenosine deaminase